MTKTMVPAVYEKGAFQVSTPLLDLPEKQKVSLLYVAADDPMKELLEKLFYVAADDPMKELLEKLFQNYYTYGWNSDFQRYIQYDIENSPSDDFLPVDLDEEPMNMWDEEMEAEFGPEPKTVEERLAFLDQTAGMWPIKDEETREWIDNLSVYNDELWP
ncbi:MAG: hypothetical protein AAF639_43605 [Chloroflexota bacterium]